MAKYRLHPIAGMILGILLALIIVGSFIGLCLVCWKPWVWLLIPGLCGITYFGAKPTYVFIKDLIEKRAEYKKNHMFQEADGIRDELKAKGIELIDTREGTTYKIIGLETKA